MSKGVKNKRINLLYFVKIIIKIDKFCFNKLNKAKT